MLFFWMEILCVKLQKNMYHILHLVLGSLTEILISFLLEMKMDLYGILPDLDRMNCKKMECLKKARLRWEFLMMPFVFDLISLFKDIGDAWIKGMWARHFQMRGSGYLEKNHSLLDFALHQDVRAKSLNGEWAGFMSATAALPRLHYFLI